MSGTTKPKTSRTRKATFWVLMIGVVIGIVFWGGFNTAMEATNTEEFCISRHEFDSMDYTKQENRSSQGHQDAEDAGLTCIDCHKGIAHSLPMQYDPEQDAPGESAFYTRLQDPHSETTPVTD
jgi:nitrate/TMAO reductase-like tetraheme cytochrome c subunit